MKRSSSTKSLSGMKAEFICALILTSKTPAKLAAFYRDVLGLPMAKRGPTDFSCNSGITHFAIHKALKGKEPTQRTEIGFHFSDLDAFVKQLESKKVKLAGPIQNYPWARSAHINDPEGNAIYLMELPKSSLKQLRAVSI